MILPRNFNLEVDFWLAIGATTQLPDASRLAGRDGMAAAHILWETCSAVQHRGLSDEQRQYGNSIFRVVFVVTSGWGCPMSSLSPSNAN